MKIKLSLAQLFIVAAMAAGGLSCSSGSNADKDLISVKMGQKWGYTDLKGQFVINPQYSYASPFREGLAQVEENGLSGFIDPSGAFVISPQYESATRFAEGLAVVALRKEPIKVINPKGETVFMFSQASVMYNFCNGMAPFGVYHADGRLRYGYVNRQGQVVVQPRYIGAHAFSQDLAPVCDENGHWGYIDRQGHTVIPFQYDQAFCFADGAAIVKQDDKFGTIGRDGQFIIRPQFGFMQQDKGGYVIRLLDSDKYGWCDHKGKIVITPCFFSMQPFFGEELTSASKKKYGGGVINRKGELVFGDNYYQVGPFFNGIAVVSNRVNMGWIDTKGEVVAETMFDNVQYYPNPDPTFLESAQSSRIDFKDVASKLRSAISYEGVNGVLFSITADDLRNQYVVTNGDFQAGVFQVKKACQWSEGLYTSVEVRGNFTKDVSDGWWGTYKKLIEDATPQSLKLMLKTEEIDAHYSPGELYSGVIKALGYEYKAGETTLHTTSEHLDLTYEQTEYGMSVTVKRI